MTLRRWGALPAAAILAAAGLAAAALAPRTAAARQVGGGCHQTHVYFDVTDVSLHERVSAHWDYGPGSATLDTVQSGVADWHQDHGSPAQRRRGRRLASFDELRGQCLLLDMSQGGIHATVPMAYTLDGTWSSGARSGTCHETGTAPRSLRLPFWRLSRDLSPRVRQVRSLWQLSQVKDLDCRFSALDPATGEYSPAHLDVYRFTYSDHWRRFAKSTFLRHDVVRLPIDLASTMQNTEHGALPGWDQGRVTRTMRITGTITLRRYRTCVITPHSDVRKLACGP